MASWVDLNLINAIGGFPNDHQNQEALNEEKRSGLLFCD